jgi:hypothetical protein
MVISVGFSILRLPPSSFFPSPPAYSLQTGVARKGILRVSYGVIS